MQAQPLGIWQKYSLTLRLTVITNSMKAAIELSNKENISVISTGGILLEKSLSFAGPLAERSLETYHVNKTFLSCKGFDVHNGMSDSNEWQALLKKRMIERSDQTILMADSSKWGNREFSHIASLQDVSRLITDSGLDPASVKALEDKKVKVTAVPLSKRG